MTQRVIAASDAAAAAVGMNCRLVSGYVRSKVKQNKIKKQNKKNFRYEYKDVI